VSYGTDTFCDSQVRTGRLVSGVTLLAQACFRRLTTPRGTLDDGDEGVVYGFDVAEYIGRDSSPEAIDGIAPAVEAELLKDDRISRVVMKATAVTDTAGLTSVLLEGNVYPYDEQAAAPFKFTIAIEDVTVSLLGVTPL
jgi:hypothetical protein